MSFEEPAVVSGPDDAEKLEDSPIVPETTIERSDTDIDPKERQKERGISSRLYFKALEDSSFFEAVQIRKTHPDSKREITGKTKGKELIAENAGKILTMIDRESSSNFEEGGKDESQDVWHKWDSSKKGFPIADEVQKMMEDTFKQQDEALRKKGEFSVEYVSLSMLANFFRAVKERDHEDVADFRRWLTGKQVESDSFKKGAESDEGKGFNSKGLERRREESIESWARFKTFEDLVRQHPSLEETDKMLVAIRKASESIEQEIEEIKKRQTFSGFVRRVSRGIRDVAHVLSPDYRPKLSDGYTFDRSPSETIRDYELDLVRLRGESWGIADYQTQLRNRRN